MTTVLTGRDVTVTVDEKVYDTQTLSAELTTEINRNEHELLSGRVRYTVDETATLEISMLADWGATESLCVAMWNAAASDPDTPLDFTMDVNGEELTGQILPVKPPLGGSGNESTEISLSLMVEGTPTFTVPTP